MLLFLAILAVLHQGNALVPVVTVQLGQPATLTCVFPMKLQTTGWFHWYKQTAGDTLKLFATLHWRTQPNYGPGFSTSRFNTAFDGKISNLTILKTATEDEGMYHCSHANWIESLWNGTYLLIKGNPATSSSLRLVQEPAVNDPSHPADSQTLQCSLFSRPDSEACPGEPRMFWFRAGSERLFPDLIYMDKNTSQHCGNTPDNEKKCSYKFSKNVASSDVGTYYCAVATCGQILLGNGTNVKIAHSPSFDVKTLVITVICLAISVITNIVLICCRTERRSCENLRESSSSQAQCKFTTQPNEDDDTDEGRHLTYAALHFSTGTMKGEDLQTQESVYSNVRYSHNQ